MFEKYYINCSPSPEGVSVINSGEGLAGAVRPTAGEPVVGEGAVWEGAAGEGVLGVVREGLLGEGVEEGALGVVRDGLVGEEAGEGVRKGVGAGVGEGVGESQPQVMVTAASISGYTSTAVLPSSLQSHCTTSAGCSVDESSSSASLHLRKKSPPVV